MSCGGSNRSPRRGSSLIEFHAFLWNLSLAYLLLGRYKEGWRYYEACFNCPDFVDVIPPTSGIALQSLGDAPASGQETLVVWSEQGIGDVIQFCRYLFLLDAASLIYFSYPTMLVSSI